MINKKRTFILLHIIIVIYSLSGLFSKIASLFPLLSLGFFLSYGAVVGALGIYAIGWQQIIKRLPLTTAFANKAVTVLWGLVWGVLFFDESITLGKIIGIMLVLLGVILFAGADEEKENVG